MGKQCCAIVVYDQLHSYWENAPLKAYLFFYRLVLATVHLLANFEVSSNCLLKK